MKNTTQNPVISKDDAKSITNTFVSALPTLPVTMLNPTDLAERMAENENSDKNDVDKLRERASLSARQTLLLDREVKGGWFNFGQPTTQMKLVPLVHSNGRIKGGIQVQLKNHREETVKMNIKPNGSNMHMASDIQAALDIADLTNQNVSFHTSSFGNWNSSQWFDQAYVTFTANKSSK